MIKDIQKLIEESGFIGKTKIVEDKQSTTILSDSVFIRIENHKAYVSFNVDIYGNICSMITLILKSICDEYSLELHVADMFVFDKSRDRVLYGNDAIQYQADRTDHYIGEEMWKEQILHRYKGVEC